MFKDKIDELGVAPAALRYKLWRLHTCLHRAIRARNDIVFVEAPSSMRDTSDMLVQEAWGPSPTHGNVLHGSQVRLAIEAALAARLAGAA